MYRILTINQVLPLLRLQFFIMMKQYGYNYKHNQDVLNKFNTINDQYTYRKEAILEYLKEKMWILAKWML